MKTFKGYLAEAKLTRQGLAKRPARPGIFARKIWSKQEHETEKGGAIVINKLTMGGKEYNATVKGDEQKFLKDFPNNYKTLVIADPKTSWSNITKTAEYGGQAGKGPTGADWESIITHHLNELIGESGADTEATERAKKFEDYAPVGELIAQNFITMFPKSGVMTQYGGGGGKANLSTEWTDHGGTNATPKTDMYTGSEKATTYNFSLKKKGGSQLASGGMGETIATFHAALAYLGEAKKDVVGIDEIMDEISKNFTQVALEYSKSELDDLKADNLSAADKKELAKFTETEKFHKELNIKLKKVMNLDDNKEFVKWYVFEAMSGFRKFKKEQRNSVASVCVTFDAVGGGLEKINVTANGKATWKSMKPSKELIAKAGKVKIYSAWKSSGSRPYSTLRVSSYDPTKKDRLVDYTLDDIIREELSNDVQANILYRNLNEDMMVLDEFALFKKVMGKIKSVGRDALSWARGFFERVMVKVKKVLVNIKKLGAKMFTALFEFLGIEITSVKETVPKDLHGFFYKMA